MNGNFREVVKLVGPNPGKTSVVMACVHGNEPCGLLAISEILPELRIDSGTVYFIIGNPNAVADNVRFTEFNLNRAFKRDSLIGESDRKSYEYYRAQYIKQYLDQSDALLDIHSSSTLGSVPFVICEGNALSIVQKFPVNIITSGFDRVNPGGTDEYMNRTGKIGICIECGEHNDPQAKDIAKEAIYSFLYSLGHIVRPVKFRQVPKRRILVESIYHSKTDKFELTKNWGDFEVITEGSIIGTDGEKPIIAQEESVILFARNCKQIGQEAFYLGREIKKLGPYGDWPIDGH
jgi:succinylglutamate desuccinylase